MPRYALLAVVVIAGCGSQNDSVGSGSAANAGQRGDTDFAAVIRSAHEPCGSATRTFLQGVKDGDEMWNVSCSDGKSYDVYVKTDGSTQVLECTVLEAVTKNKCFTKF